jgi:hypothetical protein
MHGSVRGAVSNGRPYRDTHLRAAKMTAMAEGAAVLVHNCIHEVLQGLPLSQRVQSVLKDEASLQDLLRRWDQHPSIHLVYANAALLRKTIECVMGELGDREFKTRVGVPKAFAERFAERL